jgi:hypothetical protein
MLPLAPALALALPAGTGAAAAPAPWPAQRVLTSGQFVTVANRGIELVDEDGGHPHVLVRAAGLAKIRLAAVHADAQTFLWSADVVHSHGTARSHARRVWHVSDFYGTVLGSFTVPRGGGVPTTDPEGFVAYWVQPGGVGHDAALMQRPVNVPSSPPSLLRDLGAPGSGTVTVSSDDHWVAVTLADPSTPTTVHVVGLDGRADTTVTPPAGLEVLAPGVVWSPDSTRLGVVLGPPPGINRTLYSVQVVGAGQTIPIGAGLPRLYDWSPDGHTILGGPASGPAVGVDTTTGQFTSYPVRVRSGSGVFWSGLRAGAVPRDRVAPTLAIGLPRCVGLTAKQCRRLRSHAYAWQQAIGTASDHGGSGLRYVILAAFEKRGGSWWGLVGNGKRPTWHRFPTRNQARYGATERTARLDSSGVWTIKLPGVTAGTLVLVAKAADGATNVRTRTRVAQLH